MTLIPDNYERLLYELPLDTALQLPLVYSATQAYTVGQQVSYRGDVYTAAGSTTGNPPTDGTHWTAAGVRSLFGTIWDTRIDKASVGGATWGLLLQYQYSRFDLLELQLGRIAQQAIDWEQAGAKQDDSDYAKNLKDLRDSTWAQIEVIEKQAAAQMNIAVGNTLVGAPLQAAYPCRDPNAPWLSGDPRFRRGPWFS